MKTKYDWTNVPSWVKFLFYDEDYGVIGSGSEVRLEHDCCWVGTGKWEIFFDMNPPDCEWCDSLEERPEGF